jgi:hypothetical protein
VELWVSLILLDSGGFVTKNSCLFLFVCCSGFPVWLKYVPGISFRTDNGPFKVDVSPKENI